MRIVDITDDENRPFKKEDMPKLVEQILADIDEKELTLENSYQTTLLFHEKNSKSLENSWSIDAVVQLNTEGKIDVFLDKILVFENEDEFHQMYKSLDSKNNEQSGS